MHGKKVKTSNLCSTLYVTLLFLKGIKTIHFEVNISTSDVVILQLKFIWNCHKYNKRGTERSNNYRKKKSAYCGLS
jgi:hypothetical protein